MTWQHAEQGIYGTGMAVILAIIIIAAVRKWRHDSRELDGLLRLGTADDYPVSRGLVQVTPHGPVRIEGDPDPALGQHCEYCHGLELDSAKCGCDADGCGRPWCPRYDTAVMW